ncbi:MAG: hypothetical protein EOM72_00330 [Opitutae bacterium]|nr:hypothetical protein [Opitutae bacterium]
MKTLDQQQAAAHALEALCGGAVASEALVHVVYGPGASARPMPEVVIVPSGFFADEMYGTPASLPAPPLGQIEGTPLLFGSPRVERLTGPGGFPRLIVHADIVASAFFLLTRFEEVLRREVRDEHGRFTGRESLPFRAGFLHRPIVDEYGALLRQWLREVGVEMAEPPAEIRKVYLTHDLDEPWAWPNFRMAVKSTLRNFRRRPAALLEPLFSHWGWTEGRDPNDCFSWILAQDATLRDALGARRVEPVFFFRAGGDDPKDGYDYLRNRRTKNLIRKIRDAGAGIGLHSSYSAGIDPGRIAAEKARLSEVSGCPCRFNRHHFLAAREPEDLNALETAGFTDDFTMGYADRPGFRLGTSRAVRWFDPVALRPSNVTLHPLTIMECTLDGEKYMHLDFEEARAACFALLGEVRKHNGEAVLLWHNTALSEQAAASGSYQRRLYLEVLDHLKGAL